MGIGVLIGDLFAHPAARAALWLAILLALIAGAIQIIRRIRAQAVGDEPPSSEIMTNFREMHATGRISDEEYRSIKSRLIERLQSEINDDDESS